MIDGVRDGVTDVVRVGVILGVEEVLGVGVTDVPTERDILGVGVMLGVILSDILGVIDGVGVGIAANCHFIPKLSNFIYYKLSNITNYIPLIR